MGNSNPAHSHTLWPWLRILRMMALFAVCLLLLSIPAQQFAAFVPHTELDNDVASPAVLVFPSSPRPCIVAVVEQPGTPNSSELFQSAINTWATEAQRHCDLRFFTTNIEALTYIYDAGRAAVNCIDDHCVWSHLSLGPHKWILRLPPTTFLNSDHLASAMTALESLPEGYYGVPESNQESPSSSRRCHNSGFVVGHGIAQRLKQQLDNCRGVFSRQLSTCSALNSLGHCQTAAAFQVFNLAMPATNLDIMPIESKNDVPGHSVSEFDSLLVHPFFSAAEVLNFHTQITKYLRPPVQQSTGCAMTQYEARHTKLPVCKTKCVHNPSIQLTDHRNYIPECAAPQKEFEPTTDVPTFILSLDSPDNYETFKIKKNLFSKVAGLADIRRFIATNGSQLESPGQHTKLKPGELGYIDTMRRLFEYARQNSLPRILVMDDDTMPHRNFAKKWEAIMKEERCGGHLWTQNKGGVLLLGSTIWNSGTYPTWAKQYYGGWRMADSDMKNASRAHANIQRNGKISTMCFNANAVTFGSFAAIYHHSVYSDVLRWVADTNGTQPFDWVYSHLSRVGHIVRSAFPNLVVPDVSHKSTTDPTRAVSFSVAQRAKIHKWDYSRYCNDPTTCRRQPKK